MAIRLITIDAMTMSQLGYRTAAADCADFDLVGQAADVAEATGLVTGLAPDVVVIDVALPDGASREHGIDFAGKLRVDYPRLGLVMVGPDNHDLVLKSLELSLSGYLSRTVAATVLISAIRHAAVAPTSFTSPDLAPALLRRKHHKVLSRREQEVLQHLNTGKSLASIAKLLHVTESTIRTYAARIYSKLQVHDRAEIIRKYGPDITG